MIESSKYLKTTNGSFYPYTIPDAILFPGDVTLTEHLKNLIAEINLLLADKAPNLTVVSIQRDLEVIDKSLCGKVEKNIYLSDVSGILNRLVLIEKELENQNEIPPNINAIFDDISRRLARLEMDDKYISSVPTTISVGGIEKGYTSNGVLLKDLIYSMLHPYVTPTISFTTNIPSLLNEEGVTLNNNLFTVNVSPQSNPIRKIELYVRSALLDTKNFTSNTLDRVIANFNVDSISSDSTIFAKIYDTDRLSQTNNIVVKFVKPIYCGAIDIVNETNIKAMTKRIALPSNQSYTFTLNNKSMCFAFPSDTWRFINAIDQNGFDISNSFSTSTVSVNNFNYTVLKSNTITIENFRVTFNFRGV